MRKIKTKLLYALDGFGTILLCCAGVNLGMSALILLIKKEIADTDPSLVMFVIISSVFTGVSIMKELIKKIPTDQKKIKINKND